MVKWNAFFSRTVFFAVLSFGISSHAANFAEKLEYLLNSANVEQSVFKERLFSFIRGAESRSVSESYNWSYQISSNLWNLRYRANQIYREAQANTRDFRIKIAEWKKDQELVNFLKNDPNISSIYTHDDFLLDDQRRYQEAQNDYLNASVANSGSNIGTRSYDVVTINSEAFDAVLTAKHIVSLNYYEELLQAFIGDFAPARMETDDRILYFKTFYQENFKQIPKLAKIEFLNTIFYKAFSAGNVPLIQLVFNVLSSNEKTEYHPAFRMMSSYLLDSYLHITSSRFGYVGRAERQSYIRLYMQALSHFSIAEIKDHYYWITRIRDVLHVMGNSADSDLPSDLVRTLNTLAPLTPKHRRLLLTKAFIPYMVSTINFKRPSFSVNRGSPTWKALENESVLKPIVQIADWYAEKGLKLFDSRSESNPEEFDQATRFNAQIDQLSDDTTFIVCDKGLKKKSMP